MYKTKDIIKNNYKFIILLISLVLFLFLAEDVFNKDIVKCDIIGYSIIKSFINSSNTQVMKVITWFGSATCLILLTIILFIVLKNKITGFLIAINLVIVTILNQLLKFVLQRPRPDDYRLIDESGYSFPSGHSMISMAFYGYLIYLIYKSKFNKYVKIILITIFVFLILFIGISRIYLGVHYTSDVIAGILLSISYLIVFIKLFKNDKEECYEK
ncbi:MAG: phosphatase PAP2 family protein [Tenericutes bacterium]|nr:phosphatase PAP2 family protein [Mycoplasmatota bacterium]MDD7630257.1 phosphatase PAP2 family protein [bacterium]MDY4108316.1 phosphatase PAP2 family protein [Bacilli bacterium]